MTEKNINLINSTTLNSIKRPILLPAGMLVLLLQLVFFYTLYSQEIKNSDTNMLKIIDSVEQSFMRQVDQKAFYLTSQNYFFQNNPCILSAISNNDKQKLKNCSHQLVEQLHETFELDSLSYIKSNKSYLLTISIDNLETISNGNMDKKSNYSITNKAINTQRSSYGIEYTDTNKLQMVMTFPLLIDSKIIAYVEILTDIQHIFHSLEDNYDLSLLVLLEKEYIEALEIKSSYVTQYEELGYPLWDYFNQHVLLYGDNYLLAEEQKSYFDQELLLKERVQTNFNINGVYYTAGHFALLNSSGKFIGHIGLISDNTLNMQVIKNLLIKFIISYLLITSVLFFLFYRYIQKLEKQLHNYFQALRDEIFERKKTESSLKKLSSAVKHSGSIVMITDKNGIFEYVNPRFSHTTGYSSDYVIGKTPAILKVKQTNKAFIKELWETILSGKRWVNDIQNRKKNGELYWSRLSISPILNEEKKITHFVGVSEDISELKKAHDSMRYMAFYDALTGLPNRRLFFDRLKQTLDRNYRNKSAMAILFLDLDKFKEINDTLGHDAGDFLLKAVSERLSSLLRKSDTVARQGGDEFTIILDNLNGDVIQIKTDIEKLAEKIILKISEPINLSGTTTNTSISIGITLCPMDAYSVDQLMKNADVAMYQSKKKGRSAYTFYQKTID